MFLLTKKELNSHAVGVLNLFNQVKINDDASEHLWSLMQPDSFKRFLSFFFIFLIFRHFLAQKFQLGYVQEHLQKITSG